MEENLFYLDKQSHKSKWHLVLMTSFGLIASSYCLVLPAQMQTQIGEAFNIDDPKQFLTWLTSLHFLLNSFLPFFSGLIRDFYGDRKSIIFQNGLCVIGQIIVTFGISSGSQIVFIIGRILLGWGIESLLIVLTSFICSYYKYTYLTFVLGMYQFVYTLGFVLCIWFAPQITSVGASNTIAILATTLGMLMSIVAIDIDVDAQSTILNKGAKYFKKHHEKLKSSTLHQQQQQIEGEEIQVDQQNHQEDQMAVEQVYSEILPQTFFEKYFGFFNKNQYPSIYWYLLWFYSFASTSVLVLVDYAQEFLYDKWLIAIDNGETLAWKLVTLMWLFSGVITPLLGFVIDKYGQRSSLTIFSGLMAIWAHILVLLQSPFEGLLLLGLSFSLSYTTVWSGVLYLTQPNTHGRSLSLFVCLQNFGITITPFICKFFEQLTSSTVVTEIFLLVLAILAMFISLMVYSEDKKFVNLIDRGLEVVSEVFTEPSSKLRSKEHI
ncbi:unnamed protein product [Paramecium primaurelia]|uniref:Major facilitator superfamily (MFS) profile domain-containing protein n=1 Tax=Paramecium primaurelia TaxID=5886 RepID=A0A8S1NKH8_PARPR|nr:unnamed protein product [Paramecium primaurelia]